MGFIFFGLAYYVFPSVQVLTGAIIQMGFICTIALLILMLIVFVSGVISQKRHFSERIVKWTFWVAYTFLLLAVFLWTSEELLCDSDTVINFALDGMVPPRLEGQLGPYLAGLVESDGTIYTPLNLYGADGNINAPAIKFYYNLNDIPAAEALKNVLGHGTLYEVSGENTAVLSINTASGIQDVISLINGHIRTPKHDALNILLEWYKIKDSTYSVELLPLDTSPLYSNA